MPCGVCALCRIGHVSSDMDICTDIDRVSGDMDICTDNETGVDIWICALTLIYWVQISILAFKLF
jgi:hypothetical protein